MATIDSYCAKFYTTERKVCITGTATGLHDFKVLKGFVTLSPNHKRDLSLPPISITHAPLHGVGADNYSTFVIEVNYAATDSSHPLVDRNDLAGTSSPDHFVGGSITIIMTNDNVPFKELVLQDISQSIH